MTFQSGQRIKHVLASGTALMVLCWAGASAAQESGPDNDAAASESSEIIVSGSRIRGAAPVGSTVISMDREAITSSSAVTVDRMIKEIPQNFDLGVSENSRGQAGGSGNIVYGNSVNLRGIGPYATLVMVDGHRVVNNSRSTDPSVIPSLGVERIEVVADGASAIYGSDAVAGVVNIVPRRTLDGVEAFARMGIAQRGDFNEYAYGMAVGKVFDRGQVMLAYEHVYRSDVNGSDRSFFTSNLTPWGGTDYRVLRCAPGTLRANGVSYAMPQQLTQANAGDLVAGTANRCDSQINQDLFPEQKYDSFNATATFELTDWVEIYADGFYSKRKYSRQPAETAGTFAVPETNAFFVRPAGFTGTSYLIDYNFMNDLPQNTQTGSAKSWQISPGIRFKLPHDWQVEGLVSYGKTRDAANSYWALNTATLNAALASSDPLTAFDPYGLGRTSQAVLDGIANRISLSPTNGNLTAYELRANGALISLPGGDVKLALGYEKQDFEVDLGTARGVTGTPVTWRNFGRKVDSVYAEAFIPLFGPGNATGGFERLELNAAVRYDKYSDVGSTTNPKFGANWSPVSGLVIRGSYGTSFRAPTIPEIYGNSHALYGQNQQNPLGGAPILGYSLAGPNTDLEPENATTWSVGADFDMVDNLRVSLTYFNVDYKNQVTANLSNLAILTRESEYDGTGVILRGQAARDRITQLLNEGLPVFGLPIPGGDVSTIDLFVDGRSLNLGRSITRGIDFAVQYRVELGAVDSLTVNANGTYLTSYKEAISSSSIAQDQLNNIFLPLKFKARGSVTWDHGALSTRLTATHVGGYTNNSVTPSEKVSSYTPIDLSFIWKIGDQYADNWLEKGMTFGLDIRNLFDIKPPFVDIAPGNNGSGGYDATIANPVGRMFAVSFRKSF